MKNFLHEAIREHDAGASFSDAVTLKASVPTGGEKLGTLSGHDVQGFIARGGMGAVYRALQVALEREVAVKVMTAQAESPAMAARFRREALVLGRLAHPNIVPVYDIGTDDEGQLYYTMKLVKGRTLQHILNDLRTEDAAAMREHTLASLLTIFRKVCDAMAFAHSQGVLHRDLKPENVMVGEFGEVLVMDWGLAKIQDWEKRRQGEEETGDTEVSLSPSLPISLSGMTLQGSVMGTPQYMSPEQAMGQIDELDARSDIFSLGGILYAILTLRPPVEGRTLDEVLEKVRTGSITPLTAWGQATTAKSSARTKGEVLEARKITPLPHLAGGRLPGALSAVAMKALQLDKSRRYQSVAELSVDIDAFQAGFATTAERAGLMKQLVLLVRRHQAAFATAAAALLLIITLAVWFVLNLQSKEQAALVEKEAARRAAASASLSLADAHLREAHGPAMQAALNLVPPDLRDPTWSYLLAASDSSIARISNGKRPIQTVAADPVRPGVFAFTDAMGKVTIMNVRSRERLGEFQLDVDERGDGEPSPIAFSPDGQTIAAGVRSKDLPGKVMVYRVSDGTKIKEWPALSGDHLEFGSGDALLLSGDSGVQMFDATTGQARWEQNARKGMVKALLLPSGEEVVKFSQQGLLQIVKASDGSLVRSLGGRNTAYVWFMAMRPDGKALVTWTESQTTECVSLEDGRVLYSLPDRRFLPKLGFTNDGTLLFTAALREEGVQDIKFWDALTGNFVRSLVGGQGPISALSLHPLSHELFVAGAESRVWVATGQTPTWRIDSPPTGNIAFWGPDDWVFQGWGQRGWENWGLHQFLPDGTLKHLWRPERGVYMIESSADGSLAVGGQAGRNGNVTLYRRTGAQVEKIRTLESGTHPYRMRVSPTGKRVALMARLYELDARVLDTQGTETKLELGDLHRVSDLCWLDDLTLTGLLTHQAARGELGSIESLVRWDATSGKVVKSVTHPTAMDVLAAAPDGQRFAEAGADKLVRIRDGRTLEVRSQFRAHDAPITVLAWHPTQPILATGSEDLSIKVWNLDNGRLLWEYRDLVNRPEYLIFSPSGRLLASRTFLDYIGRVWQLDTSAVPVSPPVAEIKATPKPEPAPSGVWVDVIAALNSETLASEGNGWHLESGMLLSPERDFAGMPMPGTYSDSSYQLRLRFRKLTEKATFNVALPVGGQMVDFRLDGWGTTARPQTGLTLVSGMALRDRAETLTEMQVTDAELHELDLIVRRKNGQASIQATLDDKPLVQWSGAATELSQGKIWSHTGPGRLAIGSRGAHWAVTELKVRKLMDAE